MLKSKFFKSFLLFNLMFFGQIKPKQMDIIYFSGITLAALYLIKDTLNLHEICNGQTTCQCNINFATIFERQHHLIQHNYYKSNLNFWIPLTLTLTYIQYKVLRNDYNGLDKFLTSIF